jgi:hypothetical protein
MKANTEYLRVSGHTVREAANCAAAAGELEAARAVVEQARKGKFANFPSHPLCKAIKAYDALVKSEEGATPA